MNQAYLLWLVLLSGVGALIGAGLGLFLMWLLTQQACRQYPHLQLRLPESVLPQAAADLAAWADKHGYRARPSLVDRQPCFRKGRGWLTSATEVRLLDDGLLQVDEVVNFLLFAKSYALNAPVVFGQPVRRMKLKAINDLLALWRLEPLTIAKDQVGVRIKR